MSNAFHTFFPHLPEYPPHGVETYVTHHIRICRTNATHGTYPYQGPLREVRMRGARSDGKGSGTDYVGAKG
jgi:hypothetical protein